MPTTPPCAGNASTSTDCCGIGDAPPAVRQVELLSNENEKLVSQIGRLEERLRVLERIATDPAERISREIDELRNRDEVK